METRWFLAAQWASVSIGRRVSGMGCSVQFVPEYVAIIEPQYVSEAAATSLLRMGLKLMCMGGCSFPKGAKPE